MTIARRAALGAIIFSTLLSGCVNTQVAGRSIGAKGPPARKLLVVVSGGRFSGGNMASSPGQRNLDSLVPNLVTRLPVVFSRNGLPSRAVSATGGEGIVQDRIRADVGEQILFVAPQSATYSTRTGQELYLSLKLLSDTPALTPVWQGSVRMATLGFGEFDAKVANDIAVQILQQLRASGLATVRDGALQAE